MTRFQIGPLDRLWAQAYFDTHQHQVQNSLVWFDFLKSYANEVDRSVNVYSSGEPVGFVLALQHRNLIQSLPYPASYAGVFFSEKLDGEDKTALIDKLFSYYSDYAYVFTVCTSPFHDQCADAASAFDFRQQNDILYIDLSRELLAGTDSKFRNNFQRNLRKARDAGVIVDDRSSEDDLRAWYECYRTRMEQLSAACLERDYFAMMYRCLTPSDNFKLFSARRESEYLGGIIVVYNSYCADYYLSIFNRDRDGLQGGTLAFYQLLCWAKEKGIRYLNLQASPGSQPAVYDFKKSWGAIDGRHYYLVKVLKNKESVLRYSEAQIQREYAFHYLIPFDSLIKAGRDSRCPAAAE